MARKEIKAIFNDNELNKMNSNFKELYDEFGNVVDKVSNKAYAQIVDSAKLNWKEPVESVGKLPANAFVGDTRMTRDTGKVYRNDGSTWHEIQQIDAGPVNEVDNRLTSQLAQKANQDDLENTNNELLKKANISDVNNSMNLKRDKSVPISLNDADEELLAAIEGGDGTSFNLESTPRDFSVSPIKTTFINESSNLYHHKDALVGYVFSTSSYEVIESSNYALSDFIKVDKNTEYITDNVTTVVRFESDKQYINATNSNNFNTYEAEYVRLNIPINSYKLAQMNKGTSLLPFEEGYTKLSKSIEVSPANNSVGTDELVDKSVTKDKVDFVQQTSNMLDKNNLQIGYTLSNGEPVESSNYAITDFIQVESSSQYSSRGVSAVHRFDANKNYLNVHGPNVGGSSWTTTSQTFFVRLVVPIDKLDECQLNVGELMDYEPYGYRFDETLLKETTNELWNIDKYVVEGELRGDYTAPNLEAMPRGQYSSQDIFAEYDNLVQLFPDYVTKTTLGTDSLGNNIYRYDFKPIEVPDQSVANKFPKMILISGMHGEEHTGVFNGLNSMKLIANDWQTDNLLETLRFNVHFIIVPIVNVYGFDNYETNTRVNENGVDLSRNFPYRWELNTAEPGDRTYGGPYPLSENGSSLIAQLLEENKDAIYFGSHHNMVEDERFIWIPSMNKLQNQLGKRLLSKLTRKWKKEYEWFPQDDSFFVGYANNPLTPGTEGAYASSLGIQGGTFEVSSRIGYAPDSQGNSEYVITLGAETFINWLIINLRENTNFYNSL